MRSFILTVLIVVVSFVAPLTVKGFEGDFAIIYLHPNGENVNALSGLLQINEGCIVQYDNSVVDLWIEKPIDCNADKFSFAGIILNGTQEDKVEVLRIKINKNRAESISMIDSLILLHDGSGSPAQHAFLSVEYENAESIEQF
jgi:hypothetical protein